MAQPSAASPLLEVARVLSQHLQHQQLPHWHTVCLSLRLLNTAAAAATAAASASNAAHQHEWNSHAAASNTTATAWSSPSSTSSSSSQALEQDYRAPWRARVLDGKAVAAAWSSELQQQVADLSRLMNRRPGLAVVLVGNRPDSCIYVSRKQEACKYVQWWWLSTMLGVTGVFFGDGPCVGGGVALGGGTGGGGCRVAVVTRVMQPHGPGSC